MPRIRTVSPTAATGSLASTYEEVKETMGTPVPPLVFQLSSIRPDLASLLTGLATALYCNGELPRTAKEAIATYVSALNSCGYCVGAYALSMQLHGASAEQATAARSGDSSTFTDDEDTARFLPLAEKITRHAYKVTDEDVDLLRAAGWSDEKVLEAVWIVAFTNLVNRLADTLGIASADLDSELERIAAVLAES